MWFVPMEGPMETNTAQSRQAESGLSQHQLRQPCPFQSTLWFTHLTPPRDPAAVLAYPPVPSTIPAGSNLLPCRLPLSHQTTKKPFSSHQPRSPLHSWHAGQGLSQAPLPQCWGKQYFMEDPPSPLFHFPAQTHRPSLLPQSLQITDGLFL